LQDAIAHDEPMHAGTPYGAVQATAQPPQLFTSLVVSTSQPLTRLLSQSAVPGKVHVEQPQTPAAHLGVQPEVGHDAPHPPQWSTDVSVFTSQPFSVLPSQSAYPALQDTIVQTPELHTPAPLGGAQALPHAPQLAAVVRGASQPSVTRPLQSPHPLAHPWISQLALTHAGTP